MYILIISKIKIIKINKWDDEIDKKMIKESHVYCVLMYKIKFVFVIHIYI